MRMPVSWWILEKKYVIQIRTSPPRGTITGMVVRCSVLETQGTPSNYSQGFIRNNMDYRMIQFMQELDWQPQASLFNTLGWIIWWSFIIFVLICWFEAWFEASHYFCLHTSDPGALASNLFRTKITKMSRTHLRWNKVFHLTDDYSNKARQKTTILYSMKTPVQQFF